MLLTRTQVRNLYKWIDLLRSGKYKQGMKSLKRGDLYCCWGVECEGIKGLKIVPLSFGPRVTTNEIVACDLPRSRAPDDYGLGSFDVVKLANANDGTNDFEGDQHSFAQSADWLEDYIYTAVIEHMVETGYGDTAIEPNYPTLSLFLEGYLS